jgi:hypothetical protein
MEQKDNKHSGENLVPVNVYTKAFPNNSVNKTFATGKESPLENDSTKKAEELLAPYYDEFHFANYE